MHEKDIQTQIRADLGTDPFNQLEKPNGQKVVDPPSDTVNSCYTAIGIAKYWLRISRDRLSDFVFGIVQAQIVS